MKAVKVISALLGLVFVFGTASFAADDVAVELTRDLSYHQGKGYVDIMRDKTQIARYVYKDTPIPYICPINSLSGPAVTRAYPLKATAGESADHPYQRSFWTGLGDVNGIDFWNEGEKCGKIVQTSLKFDSLSAIYWNIHSKNDWVGPDGKALMKEDRRYSFLSSDHGLLVSTMTTLTAMAKEVKIGDTADGFFALRAAPGLQLKGGKGHILNSNGEKDNDCLGKRAKWCDYTGEVDGKTVGITVFDVPTNHGFPTYWNATDYGLLAANPFGGKALTNDPKNESGITLKPYEATTFVYIVLIHEDTLDKDTLDAIAAQTAGGGQAPPPGSLDEERLKEQNKAADPVKQAK